MTFAIQRHEQLWSGDPVWPAPDPLQPARLPRSSFRTDAIVVGAGITGAFVAERLARMGRSVAVVDAQAPQHGSTAASTTLLLWELDTPLIELGDRLGFETAARVYRACVAGVRSTLRAARRLLPAARFASRPSLYLAGDRLDSHELKIEAAARRAAGLAATYLSGAGLLERMGISGTGAILSAGAGEVDPVALARALLAAACRHGARLLFPARAVAFDATSRRVAIHLEHGIEIEASHLVLATGYELPAFVAAARHKIEATWVLASPPLPAAPWPERAMIWEASDNYAYLRTTPDGRAMIGGGDEAVADAHERDGLTPRKVAALQARFLALFPGREIAAAKVWSGLFGATEDGMPMIGPVAGWPRCYAAYGYGGNGITFSALAAELLGGLVAGRRHPLLDVFAVNR
jgi:glycine/D-amino acid oxidase-like deaminating enzyme